MKKLGITLILVLILAEICLWTFHLQNYYTWQKRDQTLETLVQKKIIPVEVYAEPPKGCVEADVKISHGRSIMYGDTLYALVSIKNISQTPIGAANYTPTSNVGNARLVWNDGNMAYIFDRDDTHLQDREDRMFQAESIRMRRVGPPEKDGTELSYYFPRTPLFYGDIREVGRLRLPMPPLEKTDHPFWTAIRKELEHAPAVQCQLEVEAYGSSQVFDLKIQRRGRKILPHRETSFEEDGPRFTIDPTQGQREMKMLDKWWKEMPSPYVPQRSCHYYGMTSEGWRALQRELPESVRDLKIWITRKPMYPNAPTTVAGWRELEQSFSPSTVRDEIQLRRMILEKSLTENSADRSAKQNEIVAWLMTLPLPQRTIMASDFGIPLPASASAAAAALHQKPEPTPTQPEPMLTTPEPPVAQPEPPAAQPEPPAAQPEVKEKPPE